MSWTHKILFYLATILVVIFIFNNKTDAHKNKELSEAKGGYSLSEGYSSGKDKPAILRTVKPHNCITAFGKVKIKTPAFLRNSFTVNKFALSKVNFKGLSFQIFPSPKTLYILFENIRI